MERKRFLFTVLGVLLLTFAVVLITCVTYPERNAIFEEKIFGFVKEKKPGSEFLIFNGEDLSGWSSHFLGKWTVNNGVLTVQRGFGYLATRCDLFEDFILSLKIRAESRSNSGVYFRSSHPRLLIDFLPYPRGYEAQVDNHDPKNPTGSLYDRIKANQLLVKDNEWFEMEISVIGSNITVRINGIIVTETTDMEFKKGFIALQAHDPLSTVSFKEIRIKIPIENT